MLPRFEVARRLRPLDLLAPGMVNLDLDLEAAGERPVSASHALPQPAPYVALVADITGPATVALEAGGVRMSGSLGPDRRTGLVVSGAATTRHRSRRFGRVGRGAHVDAAALILTGPQLTLLTHDRDGWTGRARVDLLDLLDGEIDPHDPDWLAALRVTASGAVRRFRAGGFGQLGLRDLRLVSHADGTPYLRDGRPFLTATSAGAGFFATGHASVWELDPDTLDLTHRADLFARRGGKVYGDQAMHLVRDGDSWLVATSSWGSFRDPAVDEVHVEIARSNADLLHGRHVLDTRPLPLPTTGLHSVGVWDPHLVRVPATDTGAEGNHWLVGYVSASRFFVFHPVVATGADLDRLTLRAAATERRATEGTTLVPPSVADGAWRVLASDGRDGRRGERAAYPVFDLDLRQQGVIDAEYHSNLPWPTLVPVGEELLLVGFDGTPAGGRLLGYGTHGDVVVARSVTGQSREGPA